MSSLLGEPTPGVILQLQREATERLKAHYAEKQPPLGVHMVAAQELLGRAERLEARPFPVRRSNG